MRFSGSETYVATTDLNAAITLERPLLVKGEPGASKTELARQVADLCRAPGKALPRLHGAPMKNKRYVHLFERIAFMARGRS